jgi:hypothetical protein
MAYASSLVESALKIRDVLIQEIITANRGMGGQAGMVCADFPEM